MDDLNEASVLQLEQIRPGLSDFRYGFPGASESVGAPYRNVARGQSLLKDGGEVRAELHFLGREPIELRVLTVEDDEPVFFVEHAKALGHIVDRPVEARILFPQQLGALPERSRVAGCQDIDFAVEIRDEQGEQQQRQSRGAYRESQGALVHAVAGARHCIGVVSEGERRRGHARVVHAGNGQPHHECGEKALLTSSRMER